MRWCGYVFSLTSEHMHTIACIYIYLYPKMNQKKNPPQPPPKKKLRYNFLFSI